MKRRAFLNQSGSVLGTAWLGLNAAAVAVIASQARIAYASGQAFKVLSPAEAETFEAMAAQIIPSDDSPGAREAGVIHFIDQALAGIRSHLLPSLRAGLADLQMKVQQDFGADSFSDLTQDLQQKVLKGIEHTPFFGDIRWLTLAGMFSLPVHGGNQNLVGWKLLGFEGPIPSQPPFGYYDKDYLEKGK